MSPDSIVIAVIVPAHRQPGLLGEAIASALGQEGAPPTAIVVVDDGCPFPETARTASAFAAAHPGRVFALRRPNGGLSAARNTGIEFALAAFPALQAVYFLDADNRLHPPFLGRAWGALEAAPTDTGWVYPDFDRFGLAAPESSTPWSLLSCLTANMVEAGSLVRRAVLDAGLRFDETMRGGYEDWDFWLRAAAAGFRGQHLPDAGFRYRKRPESMLADSERQGAAITATLRHKPEVAKLLAPRSLLALEAEEAPRFALYGTDPQAAVRLLLDPATEGTTIPAAEARRRLLAAEADPVTAPHFPLLLAFADAAACAALAEARMLRTVFWHAARAQAAAGPEALVAVGLYPAPEDAPETAGIAAPSDQGRLPEAGILLVPRRLLATSTLPGAARGRIESLATDRPVVPVRHLHVTLPAALMPQDAAAEGTTHRRLLLETALLRQARGRQTRIRAGWRIANLPPRETAATRAAAAIGSGPLLPHLPAPGQRSIGFVLPLFTLGGVERVVLNQARVLRARGWATRLVVLGGGDRMLLPALAREAFDEVAALTGRAYAVPDWRLPYLGAEMPDFGGPAAQEALGLLAGLDAVVATHSLAGHALMAPLRRLGTRCYAGLHLVERGGWGEPIGTPHTALGFEHAYDGAIVISEGLAAWCAAQGWPEAKLHLVRNAPGHPTPPAAVVAALVARAARRAGRLRALFLGRLDAQKGVDRLAALIASTRGVVDWRVVGRPVLAQAMPALGLEIEPPVADPAALDALYAWADVLVLPSRFEGVPLTVLEAQRMGCAVLATEAGETGEIVTDGEDGFLVPQRGRAEDAIVAEMAGRLRCLAADPPLLLEVGRRAAARVAAAGWEETMAGFLAHLDAVVPAR